MIKIFRRYFRSRWERFYFKNPWHLILDLSLIMLVIILSASLFGLYFYRPALPGLGSLSRPALDFNQPPLEVELTVSDPVWSPGEGLKLNVTLKNKQAVSASNLIISFLSGENGADLSVERLHLDNEEVLGQGIKIDGQKIFISQIRPYSEQALAVELFLSVKNPSSRLVNWRAQVEYFLAGQALKSSLALEPLLLKADINFQSAAYYTSPLGDQLGIGPLPPLVGIPTKYWIFWEVSSAADFSDLVLSARLPQTVNITEQRSVLAGEFLYHEGNRQIIWRLPKINAGPEPYQLRFEVELIPEDQQVGQIVTLLTNGQYYGRDDYTNKDISGFFTNITTNLDKDRFNVGQGRVEQP